MLRQDPDSFQDDLETAMPLVATSASATHVMAACGSRRGRMFAFELKIPPNRVVNGSLQWKNLKDIRDAGGYAKEVTPLNFDQIFEEFLCSVGYSEEKNK